MPSYGTRFDTITGMNSWVAPQLLELIGQLPTPLATEGFGVYLRICRTTQLFEAKRVGLEHITERQHITERLCGQYSTLPPIAISGSAGVGTARMIART